MSFHPLVDMVQSRRDEACFIMWLAASAAAVTSPVAREADLVRLEPQLRSIAVWLLLLSGVALRLWAAGNLVKNRPSNPAGPYRLVRHPLYLGTIVISLSFFVALGTAAGLALWVIMIAFVFLPVLRKEERELDAWFPGTYSRYAKQVPALMPDPRAFAAAWRTSRFSVRRCGRNFGLKALAFFPLVPALAAGTAWVHSVMLLRQ